MKNHVKLIATLAGEQDWECVHTDNIKSLKFFWQFNSDICKAETHQLYRGQY